MKHIFTIHSHITFLAALGTITREKLPTKDVLLICSSGYQPAIATSFKGKIVLSYDQEEAKNSLWKKMQTFNYTKSVNRYIEQLTNQEPYVAYVDLMSVFNRYLVMHSNCLQFHIIEEGIVNYGDYDDFRLWTADLRDFDWQWSGFSKWKQILNAVVRLLRGRSLRLLAMPVHPNLYTLHRGVNAYCFSDLAFQYTPKIQKKLLDWKAVLPLIDSKSKVYPDGSWFWIGDTLCKGYGVSMDDFENALQILMEQLNPQKEVRMMYLKFRGSESDTEKKLTLTYLEKYNFEVKLLPSSEIMELVFLKAQDLKVCGIVSSLLIYAHLMGHQTYSLYSYIPNTYGVTLHQSYASISKKVGYII